MKITELFILGLFLFMLNSVTNAQFAEKSDIKTEESIQTNTIFRTRNSIEFMGNSENREVQVEVTDEGGFFSLDINGEIQHGSLRIEIFDPEGKKQGSFFIGDQTENKIIKSENLKKNNYEEKFSGEIIQQNTISGIWHIKIVPNNAYGRLSFWNQQSPKIESENSINIK